MKYIQNIRQELSTKWSSRLLLALFSLVILNIFAVNITLKKQYDVLKTKPFDRFVNYKPLLEKPFKYVKIEGARSVIVENKSDMHAVLIHKEINTEGWLEYYAVENDTLFIRFNKKYEPESYYRLSEIYVLSPYIQALDIYDSRVYMDYFTQKVLRAHISHKASLNLKNNVAPLDSCFINIAHLSEWTINNSESIDSTNRIIRHLDLTSRDNCTINLSKADVQYLKLNATKDNAITLNSETLKKMIGQ